MKEYDFAVQSVKEAGELLLSLREEKFETREKGGDPRNIVTSVDFAVNTFLEDKLKREYPDDALCSEEDDGAMSTKKRLWAIDPIDGSSNFSRGIPHFAICICLLDEGMPLAGAVYNPVTQELFSFKKGGGAFLNGKRISVSPITKLNESFVLLHAGRKPELWEWGGRAYRALLEHAKKTSNLAGSALDLCFVATGRVEAAVYGTGTLIDIAAAVGILNEAGGIVVDRAQKEAPISQNPTAIVAANNAATARSLCTLLFT